MSPCIYPRLERSPTLVRMTLPATLRGQCTFPISFFSTARWVWAFATRTSDRHLVLLPGIR